MAAFCTKSRTAAYRFWVEKNTGKNKKHRCWMKKMDEHQQKSGDEVEEDDIFRKERPVTYR